MKKDFLRHLLLWREATVFMSIDLHTYEHPHFQRLVAYGYQALPWVVEILDSPKVDPGVLELLLRIMGAPEHTKSTARGYRQIRQKYLSAAKKMLERWESYNKGMFIMSCMTDRKRVAEFSKHTDVQLSFPPNPENPLEAPYIREFVDEAHEEFKRLPDVERYKVPPTPKAESPTERIRRIFQSGRTR